MSEPSLDPRIMPVEHDDVAPDGSLVRLLSGTSRGGMAHFELGAGEVSIAQRHRTVEEIWFILDGVGEMWRRLDGKGETTIDLRHGVSFTIPVGTEFQFRNTGRVPLAVIGVTMPPWPGTGEATTVPGIWTPRLDASPRSPNQ